jgi:bifunctional DNA-binding transcriptional regulator/antitoxin component of YhaV-PrlF toxin-antitoxin module
MTKKTLLPTNDLYLQFTDEEIQELGWEAGQRLEVKQHEDGSIELRPYVKMEIDMADWSRDVLELIIKESCEKDISVNDVISELLKKSIDVFDKCPTEEDLNQAKKELLLEAAAVDPNFTNNDTSICNS